jgi:hypothetical protein
MVNSDLFLAIHGPQMLRTCREDVAACMFSHCEIVAQSERCNASYQATSEGRKLK